MNPLKLIYENIIKDNVDLEKVEHEKKKKIYVWGSSVTGCELKGILNALGIKTEAFLDSSKDKQGRIIDGVKVLEPECCLNDPEATIIVAIVNNYGLTAMLKADHKSCRIFFFTEYLLELTDINKKILEIGPYIRPFFAGKGVKYCDIYSGDEMRRMQGNDKNKYYGTPKTIHFVSGDGTLDKINEKFDFVYSSHLIEHQIDIIRHLQNTERILNQGGKYLIAIPDKRYCFNFYSDETKIFDVLEAYELNRRSHSLKAYFNMMILTHNDAVRHWAGDHGEIHLSQELYTEAVEGFKNSKYKDMHEWYFTPDSFSEIINGLNKLKLIGLKIENLYETTENSNTFFAVLSA